MRLIDADALKERIAEYPYGYRGMIENDIAQIPTVSPKAGYIEFADWVAEEVMREDFGDGFFAEVACRKLYRLGIIKMDGEKWKLEGEWK